MDTCKAITLDQQAMTCAKTKRPGGGPPRKARNGSRDGGRQPDERIAILKTIHRNDQPGIAEYVSRCLMVFGAKLEAASGVRLGTSYYRQVLLIADDREIERIQRWLATIPFDGAGTLSVLPAGRCWTFSGMCPFADDVEAGTSTLLQQSGINIEWETRLKSHAAESGLLLLYQHLLVTLPSTLSLTEFEQVGQVFEQRYGGHVELLPGACLTVLSSM